VSDRYDRAVGGVLAAGVLVCAAAAVAFRPAPLPAADAARWIALAGGQGGNRHQYGRSWQIETLAIGTGRQPYVGQVVALARGETLTVSGWALDPRTRRPAARVLDRVDRGPWRPVRYGLPGGEIAARAGPAAERSGFATTVAAGALAPGPHALELATAPQHGGPQKMSPALRFLVNGP
jgi:hypothetical protein